MLSVKKLDIDTLEDVVVNDLFVVVTVDSSFTTEQAISGSLGTQRCLGFLGQLFLLERTPQQ